MSLPKRDSADGAEHLPVVTGRRPLPHIVLKGKTGDETNIAFDHIEPDEAERRLMEAFGTNNRKFVSGLLAQIANATSTKGDVDAAAMNFTLSVVEGIQPRDQMEAMLAAQMAAVHGAIMTFARRLNNVDNLAQQDSAERAFNRLARTFTAQVEALKRYRSQGEQTITVEHVTVNQGGQAIVGNVQTGEGRGGRKPRH